MASKNLIIIGIAAAVAMVLGAVALMTGKDNRPKTSTIRSTSETGDHEASSGKITVTAASTIYPLKPFIIHIYDGQELRSLRVTVELEVTDPAIRPALDAGLAQIRDAILVLLISKTYQEILDVGGKIQLKEDILAVINKIISPGKVSKVYFADFIVQ